MKQETEKQFYLRAHKDGQEELLETQIKLLNDLNRDTLDLYELKMMLKDLAEDYNQL